MDRPLLAALIVAVGVTAAGFFVGDGFARARRADRYLEVKGLAEREVTANLALWPLRFATSSDDLAAAQAQITKSYKELGGIRQANQGVFVILPRDQAPGVSEGSQLRKIVRVVSTVQYLLE